MNFYMKQIFALSGIVLSVLCMSACSKKDAEEAPKLFERDYVGVFMEKTDTLLFIVSSEGYSVQSLNESVATAKIEENKLIIHGHKPGTVVIRLKNSRGATSDVSTSVRGFADNWKIYPLTYSAPTFAEAIAKMLVVEASDAETTKLILTDFQQTHGMYMAVAFQLDSIIYVSTRKTEKETLTIQGKFKLDKTKQKVFITLESGVSLELDYNPLRSNEMKLTQDMTDYYRKKYPSRTIQSAKFELHLMYQPLYG